MPKIIISGCNGRMGQTVARICRNEAIEIAAGFDIDPAARDGYPVHQDPFAFIGEADVVVDFSNPAALAGLVRYCIHRNLPAVLCVTGYETSHLQMIESAAKEIPIFKSANMALGVNLMAELVRKAVRFLGGSFDIEIVERHHKMKVDAPSGTALLLADAAREALPFDVEYVYERQGRKTSRGDHEIGISAVRGGTIVGEHEVIFAGADEVIEIRHAAYSRDVFASGAVAAAKYIAGVSKPGIYTMNHMLAK